MKWAQPIPHLKSIVYYDGQHDARSLAFSCFTESHFWGMFGPGYDRNLFSPRYIWNGIDYLHDNPVRRGLVERQVDWRWSSAAAYAENESYSVPIDFESLPGDPR